MTPRVLISLRQRKDSFANQVAVTDWQAGAAEIKPSGDRGFSLPALSFVKGRTMSDNSLLAEKFAAGCDHLYVVAVSSDDPDWPVVKNSYYDGRRYDSADTFCGPAPLQIEDSIGSSLGSSVFPSRPLSSRWIFGEDRLWEFAFIDDRKREAHWIQHDNRNAEFNSLLQAVDSFGRQARIAAVSLKLQREAIDKLRRVRIESLLGPMLREDAADLWYALLLRVMPETQSGQFRIRKTKSSVFAESVEILKATEAAADDSGKSDGGAASTPDLNAEATTNSDGPTQAQQDAFDAFAYAQGKEQNPKLTQKEAYDFWTDPKRGLAAEDRDEYPQLKGYVPGKFSSYKTNLSNAANHPAINQPRYGKRKRNVTGQNRQNGRKMIGDDGT